MNLTETWNAEYIEAQYKLWKNDPDSVSRDWQFFFTGFEIALSEPRAAAAGSGEINDGRILQQTRIEALIFGYRSLGHLLACLDPLVACPTEHPLLTLEAFDLKPDDLNQEFQTAQLSREHRAPLRDIIAALRETYCHSIGVEFMHLQDPTERQWLIDRMEPSRNKTEFDPTTKHRILNKLTETALFEQFLNKKYIGVTRFSLEGGDAVIPALDLLVEHAAEQECREVILGMAHRGRLNIQAHILGKPYAEIFSEFENCYDPQDLYGSGDVKYHHGYLGDIKTSAGRDLRIYLMSNPSHLESVDPVVEGFARARQDILEDARRRHVLPVLIHGDAAFAGQGVVAETLNLSQLEGYKTGGTIHLVINNQIGYTTLPEDARSTRYSTDIAKMLMVPIFHVHGEDPEAVAHVVRLAVDYRNAFGKDIVLDVVCYRRYGHNEGDEPYFTQPQMYDRIRQRPSLHTVYATQLLEDGVITELQNQQIANEINQRLDAAYDAVHGSECPYPENRFFENWNGMHSNYSDDLPETGLDKKQLMELANRLNQVPDTFSINPKLKRLFNKRLETVEKGKGIDWANAETLAFGSLVTEGILVRLSGQDSGRGTFSQRHSVLVDSQNGESFTPLQSLDPEQAPFWVYNSSLSEVGVMGFEYGYSIGHPRALVLWEAQFGDFANNAQTVIDLYIVSGESKWERLSGLVLLLPHGWEGLGPEHSSARLERFLQLCADDNIQVCNPTTPSQYFHLLRRQVIGSFRKPLVIMTPKSLLRNPAAVSDLKQFTSGSFQPILDDAYDNSSPKTVILCSGKIYYDLDRRRLELKNKDTVIVRLEQFYPFPELQLKKIAARYQQAQKWCWVQEEPQNMGGWQFVKPRIEAITGKNLRYIGRDAAASPATGFPGIYRIEQASILDEAVGSLSEQQGRVAAN